MIFFLIIFIFSELSKRTYFIIMGGKVKMVVFKESRSVFKVGISSPIISSETGSQ